MDPGSGKGARTRTRGEALGGRRRGGGSDPRADPSVVWCCVRRVQPFVYSLPLPSGGRLRGAVVGIGPRAEGRRWVRYCRMAMLADCTSSCGRGGRAPRGAFPCPRAWPWDARLGRRPSALAGQRQSPEKTGGGRSLCCEGEMFDGCCKKKSRGMNSYSFIDWSTLMCDEEKNWMQISAVIYLKRVCESRAN